MPSPPSIPPDLRKVLQQHGERLYELERRNPGAIGPATSPATLGVSRAKANTSGSSSGPQVFDFSTLTDPGSFDFGTTNLAHAAGSIGFGGGAEYGDNGILIADTLLVGISCWAYMTYGGVQTVTDVLQVLLHDVAGATQTVQSAMPAINFTLGPAHVGWFGLMHAGDEIGIIREGDTISAIVAEIDVCGFVLGG